LQRDNLFKVYTLNPEEFKSEVMLKKHFPNINLQLLNEIDYILIDKYGNQWAIPDSNIEFAV